MYADWAYWELYHKVTFDGLTKQIIINAEVTSIDIKTDIYSSWKEWVAVRDNSKFLQAVRTIGGDSVGGGLYAGDIYFLMNGWQIVVNQAVAATGILYHDDGLAPFIITPGGGITSTVSNLAYAYSTTGGSGATPAEVWAYSNRTLTSSSAPTVQQIRTEIDTNSTQLQSIKAKTDTIAPAPTAAAVASQVRTELTPELTHLMTLQNNTGLTATQTTMLLEMYNLLGLDPTQPLTVTNTVRTAGTISQTISTSPTSTVVTRI